MQVTSIRQDGTPKHVQGENWANARYFRMEMTDRNANLRREMEQMKKYIKRQEDKNREAGHLQKEREARVNALAAKYVEEAKLAFEIMTAEKPPPVPKIPIKAGTSPEMEELINLANKWMD